MDGGKQSLDCIAPELLTLRQAAELCSVSDRTLWTWANSGVAPAALKIGRGTVRYCRAAYISWIRQGCQPLNGGANHADETR